MIDHIVEGEMARLEESKFETETLGIRVGKVVDVRPKNVKKIIADAKGKYDYLLYICETKDFELINAMQEAGFKIMGVPIALECDLTKTPPPGKSKIKIRPYKEKDLQELKEMSRGAFRNVHWYNEKRINPKKIDEIYVRWVENDCKGRAAIVLVAEEDGKPIGYNACTIMEKDGERIGHIDLVVVSHKTRQKGVGTALVNASLDWVEEQGFKKMDVKTEANNYAALRMYQKAGFRIVWTGFNINKSFL